MTISEYLEIRRSKWPELKKRSREQAHRELLLGGVSSMFVREGLPDELDGSDMIEEWLLTFGAVGYVKPGTGKGGKPSGSYKRSEYRVGWVSFGGDPYPDGLGSDAIVNGYDGYVETFPDWRHNDNIVVAFNMKNHLPDMAIPYTAEFLQEYDTSLQFQIYYSRLFPIPTANSDKTLAALQDALDNMDKGKMKAILSKNIFDELTGGTGDEIKVIQLSDPKASDHIQYLDHGKDDIYRWFWRLYGMDIQGASKMAQQTNAEVQSGLEQSMIIPHAMYHQRQKEAADLKRVFGWDVSIAFAEPWQNMFAKCEREEELLDDREMAESPDHDRRDSEGSDTVSGDEHDHDSHDSGVELDRNDS